MTKRCNVASVSRAVGISMGRVYIRTSGCNSDDQMIMWRRQAIFRLHLFATGKHHLIMSFLCFNFAAIWHPEGKWFASALKTSTSLDRCTETSWSMPTSGGNTCNLVAFPMWIAFTLQTVRSDVKRQKASSWVLRVSLRNTNPRQGPFHFRSPAKILWRTIRGMVTTRSAWFDMDFEHFADTCSLILAVWM